MRRERFEADGLHGFTTKGLPPREVVGSEPHDPSWTFLVTEVTAGIRSRASVPRAWIVRSTFAAPFAAALQFGGSVPAAGWSLRDVWQFVGTCLTFGIAFGPEVLFPVGRPRDVVLKTVIVVLAVQSFFFLVLRVAG